MPDRSSDQRMYVCIMIRYAVSVQATVALTPAFDAGDQFQIVRITHTTPAVYPHRLQSQYRYPFTGEVIRSWDVTGIYWLHWLSRGTGAQPRECMHTAECIYGMVPGSSETQCYLHGGRVAIVLNTFVENQRLRGFKVGHQNTLAQKQLTDEIACRSASHA